MNNPITLHLPLRLLKKNQCVAFSLKSCFEQLTSNLKTSLLKIPGIILNSQH